MDATAAQAQVQFALQTDSQLTQGSASLIHAVPNAPVGPLPAVQSAPDFRPGRLQRGAIHAFRSGGGHRRLFRAQTASFATVPAAARRHVGKAPSRLNRNQAQAEEEEPAGYADPRQRPHHEQ